MSLTIIRADHYGMCFGVKDAVEMALAAATEKQVTILGNLVHNETVINRLKANGISIESRLEEVKTGTVMITAHGTSDRMRAQIKAQGFEVLEATCPLVHHAHRSLQHLVARGFHPVVIGKKGHVEVEGLVGDFPGACVVLTEEDVDALPAHDKIGIVSQTTQPIDRVKHLVTQIKLRHPNSEVEFADTVCQPTKQRQRAAIQLAKSCSIVIVIGGAESNNTRELVDTCRAHCRRVHHVITAADLRPEWFFPFDKVGITAGTSTPEETIQAVETTLQTWNLL